MPEKDATASVTAPGEGRVLRNPLGGPLTIKAGTVETGDVLTALESTPAPGEGPPLHRHAREDEVIYVLRGRLRFRLEDAIHEAPTGSFVFIPRGVPHAWQNVGDDEARLLVLFTPAAPGMERFFERFGDLADDARVAEAFKELADDSGMEVLGPPLAQSHPSS
jgi:quercetin dioxygenase-like cupin family protein